MTTEEISEILKLHKAWLNGEKHGKRASLSGANLYGPRMCHIRLRHAQMKVNLSGGKNVGTVES